MILLLIYTRRKKNRIFTRRKKGIEKVGFFRVSETGCIVFRLHPTQNRISDLHAKIWIIIGDIVDVPFGVSDPTDKGTPDGVPPNPKKFSVPNFAAWGTTHVIGARIFLWVPFLM